ncbi:Aste57867_11683 [Aphanomyces stellatus]|uniref:Aste57867_11683 protein n=1 Tax=Aphanomyces stellatus TaxID=120398 RepID=A0A485KU47_9STRA|nr:hypothetical protein As57867_011640 [Aphanomyces stellatus]VFT88540.1 Aste57867_11683 [Aphanomyces stellatus]
MLTKSTSSCLPRLAACMFQLASVVAATNTTDVIDAHPSVAFRAADIAVSTGGLLLLFLGLAIICDDYLVPAIELLCERLSIPDDAAGASFLAFGSAAPEIVLNAVATAEGRLESMEATVSAIQGSAMIAFAVIPALCVLVISTPLAVSWAPMLRDSGAYILSLGALVVVMHDSVVTAVEALVLCGIYVVYLLVIFLPLYCQPKHSAFVTNSADAAASPLLGPHHATSRSPPPTYGATITMSTAALDDPLVDPSEQDELPRTWLQFVLQVLSEPFHLAFQLTLPTRDGDTYSTRHLYLLALALSIGYVALFSAGALYLTRRLSSALGLSSTTAGATLLALGAQIPDTMASVSLARAGHADAAVCNAIGSQVINVTLGSGLPWALYALFESSIRIPFKDETMLWKSLAVVVGAYILLTFNVRRLFCGCFPGDKPSLIGLTKVDGAVLLLLYVLCNVAIVLPTT